MSDEQRTEDWEQVVAADLAPYLIPAAQPRVVRRPADVNDLPDGAHAALTASIGRHGLEDMLIVPATTWLSGRRRRCLYSPLCVVGIGERGAGLWVQALPVPGVRILLPFSEIAAVEHSADGPQHQLIVTGRPGRLAFRYAAGETAAGYLARRLRLRAAGIPEPVPLRPPARHLRRRQRAGPCDMALFRLDTNEQVVSAGGRSRTGRGSCLLAVTARELIITRVLPAPGHPRRQVTRTLYVARWSIHDARVRSGVLLLRSAGSDLEIGLCSRAAAAAASWWARLLSEHDRSDAGSSPGLQGSP